MTPARGGGCHVSVLGYKENVNFSYGKKKKKKHNKNIHTISRK
jgi:hypothetical protein